MFAVLKTGGKQYKVAKGDVFTIEKLDAVAGESVKFAEVLMLGGDTVTVGAPFIAGAAVVAEVVEQTRGPHTVHYVKRRRKHSSQRKKGHRQHLTLVKVTDILAKGADKADGKAATGARLARAAAHVQEPKAEAAAKPAKAAAAKPAKAAKAAEDKPAAKAAAKPAAKKPAKSAE